MIEAITVYRAQTWTDMQDLIGLSPKSLKRVLAELFAAEAINKGSDDRYWVRKDLYHSYNDYIDELEEYREFRPASISEDEQKHLVRRIDEWKQFRGLSSSLQPGHFFLEGPNLYDLSLDLIQRAIKEVLVANPYVDQCDLSDKLREVVAPEKTIILVTRQPDDKSAEYRKRKEDYHKTLRESGVKLTYNSRVRAKLIVLDRSVAVVSSMNLNSSSTGGSSWEAGMSQRKTPWWR